MCINKTTALIVLYSFYWICFNPKLKQCCQALSYIILYVYYQFAITAVQLFLPSQLAEALLILPLGWYVNKTKFIFYFYFISFLIYSDHVIYWWNASIFEYLFLYNRILTNIFISIPKCIGNFFWIILLSSVSNSCFVIGILLKNILTK